MLLSYYLALFQLFLFECGTHCTVRKSTNRSTYFAIFQFRSVLSCSLHYLYFAGFSEFVEFVCRVAVEGMQQENYDVVFPTPFSKVIIFVCFRNVGKAISLVSCVCVRFLFVDSFFFFCFCVVLKRKMLHFFI